MTLSVLVSDMITEIRELSDMTSSNFVTDSEIVRYLDKAYRKLYMQIVKANKSYFVLGHTISIVSQQDSYTLPTDFFKLVGADLLINNDTNNRINLLPFSFNKRNLNKTQFFAYSNNRGFRYYFRGNEIVFTPIPDGSNTAELWYIPDPVAITSTSQTLVLSPAIVADFLILDVAIKCLIKEETDATPLMIELEKLSEEILQATAERDDGLPEIMTDTSFLDDQLAYYAFFPR